MITKEMRVNDILALNCDLMEVFANHGRPCLGCPGANMETLEEAADGHGVDLDLLLADLNAKLDR